MGDSQNRIKLREKVYYKRFSFFPCGRTSRFMVSWIGPKWSSNTTGSFLKDRIRIEPTQVKGKAILLDIIVHVQIVFIWVADLGLRLP